jgi:hypothetical protein
MKKYLLPNDGNFYKANLHMHTTISDGNMTPEETKKAFLEKGYSIVAFTDHEVMVPHLELTDENFLALTSTEISVNKRTSGDFMFTKCYHLNFYSRDHYKSAFNSFDERKLWLKHSKEYITEEQSAIHYDRVYSVECINEMIKMANEEECLVSLNHPVWSLQDYSDYIDLKGLWGVEWHNSGCVNSGFVDTIQPIDDLLRNNENVFPLATDDAHKIGDCFQGFVMVKAPALKHEEVYDALKRGDFYSSQKPLIDELYIEDGIIHIKTSKAKKIVVTSDKRYTSVLMAKEGQYLTNETLDISWYLERCDESIIKNEYIRIQVVDEDGFVAHTRAYYLNELM